MEGNANKEGQGIDALAEGDWVTFWKCERCHADLEDDDCVTLKRKERDIQQILQSIERDLMSRKNFDPSGGQTTSVIINQDDLPDLIQECIDELSSTHFLTIKALRLLVVSTTTQAYMRIKQHVGRGISTQFFGPSVSSAFRMSVVAGCQLVLACECVAVSCTGCYLHNEGTTGVTIETSSGIFNIRHAPLYDRATPMRHVVENLLQLPLFLWPSSSMTMVYRYLPILRIKFKSSLRHEMKLVSGDTTVDLLEMLKDCCKMLQCKDCETYWDGTIESIVGVECYG
jgi:hypothetical protein